MEQFPSIETPKSPEIIQLRQEIAQAKQEVKETMETIINLAGVDAIEPEKLAQFTYLENSTEKIAA